MQTGVGVYESQPAHLPRGPSVAARRRFHDFLRRADIEVGGSRPWDLRVHDDRVFRRVLLEGSLGLGESYIDGWWDVEELDAFFHRLVSNGLEESVDHWAYAFHAMAARLFNRQTGQRAFEVGRRHYDIGNDLYRAMLDPRMIYSCGYWRDASSLEEAQEAKLELVFQKLQLEPGMRVLDIGCGWGGAAKLAAERYGVSVVGVTVSQRQVEIAREAVRGLDVEILLQDYREVGGTFDRIFSIGMFEHVGRKNYGTFFDVVRRCLPDDGAFLLHTIGGKRSVVRTDPWYERYIFPNSMLPSAAQITAGMEARLVLEDWHCFGPDYDRTLMSWFSNFRDAWPRLRHRYDERFFRMWKYYLLSCAGAFRAGKAQVWQILMSPKGLLETRARHA